MKPVTMPAPPELAEALTRNRAEVTLLGVDGRPVGHVLTPEHYQVFLDAMSWKVTLPPTEEELEASIQRGGEHSMEEVWKLLEEA